MADIDMFKLYDDTTGYTPDNRPKHREKKQVTIMVGETTVHSFDVPFGVTDGKITGVLSFRALYKLGVEVVLIKDGSDATVEYNEEREVTTITWTLSPSDTLKFKHTYLDTHVQLEFVLDDHSISYTDVLKVKILNSLDSFHEGEV